MPAAILDLHTDWAIIRGVFKRAQTMGLYHGFSTVNEDGTPNITPIGSLVLSAERPGGFYFDVFNRTLASNLDSNPQVAILAVDNRKIFWLKSVLAKRFKSPPAIRLAGRVSAKCPATTEEIRYCLEQVTNLRRFGASKKLANRLKYVRKIEFTRVDILNIGAMTKHPW